MSLPDSPSDAKLQAKGASVVGALFAAAGVAFALALDAAGARKRAIVTCLAIMAAVTLGGVLLYCTGCATPAILTPKTGPGTEYPCGIDGVSCGPDPAKPVACCPSESVCGGTPFSGCPAGYCCFTGGDGVGAARDAGGDVPAHAPRCSHASCPLR